MNLLTPFSILPVLVIATACSSSDTSNGNSVDDCSVVSLAADIWPGLGFADPGLSLVLNGKLYFTANDGVHGEELWTYSPTTGAELIDDIVPGTGGSNPGPYTTMNGKLYFSVNDDVLGEELWVFDPNEAAAGATLVEDIYNGSASSGPKNFIVIDNRLYFTASDEVYGNELRVYSEDSGVSLVADFRPGSDSGYPGAFTTFEDHILFLAAGLWSLNRDSGELQQISINADGAYSFFFETAIEFNGKLYFPVNDGIHGTELWVYAPDSGVELVVDLNPGSNDADPSEFAVIDGKLYFGANDGVHGTELWVYDPVQGASLVADISPSNIPSGYLGEGRVLNGKLYFQAWEPVHGAEIWVFDPTDGVALLADLKPSEDEYEFDAPNLLVVFDDKLYFQTIDEVNGLQRWVYDPVNVENGPMPLDEIWPGSGITKPPDSLTELDGKLYFSAYDGMHGNELWAYDPACE